MNVKKIGVIVLNWNSYDESLVCVKSVLNQDYLNVEVLIVDNHSSDNSFVNLKNEFYDIDNVSFLQTGSNLGYCGGNNAGISFLLNKNSDFVLILNNDVEFKSSKTIQSVIDCFSQDRGIKIVSPMVNGETQHVGRFFKIYSYLLGKKTNAAINLKDSIVKEYVCGCTIAFERDFLLAHGAFDDDFFMYNEEVDVCYRAALNGFLVVQMTNSTLSVKRKIDNDIKILKPYIWYYQSRNMILFLKKNHVRLRFLIFFIYILISIIKPVRQRNIKNIFPIIKGLFDGFKSRKGKVEI